MRPCKLWLLVLSLAVAASGCAPAATPTPTPAPTPTPIEGFTIAHVAVVDVEKGVAVPDQTVVIAGERILRVAPDGAAGLRSVPPQAGLRSVPPQAGLRSVPPQAGLPATTHTIDGRGLYLMPGLVDAHVHFFDPQVFGRLMLANGVLLVRDMGQVTQDVLKTRAELNAGALLGPEMIATGYLLDGAPAQIPQIALALATPDEGRAAVRQQVQAGVDQIKVYSALEKDVYLAILDEAQKLGIKAVGHVPETVYVEDAAAAGQRSIEHLHGFDKLIGTLLGLPVTLRAGGMGSDARYWPRLQDVDHTALQTALRRIAATGVAVCPTVLVFQKGVDMARFQSGNHPLSEYISPGIREIWKTLWDPSQAAGLEYVWPLMQAFVAELHEAGVTLMVGTDLVFPGIIPGYAVHEEMARWQEAGLPAADILRSATIVPARFMGLDGRLGTVSEGKAASLVLVRANPLEDIQNARQVEAVFLRGKYLSRADLDRLLAEARQLAGQ